MNIKSQLLKPVLEVLKTFSGEQQATVRPSHFQNVFGFYSPTGGTGVTTFIANLATVMASQKKIALLDLDIYYPSLFRFFMSEVDEEHSLRFDILDKFMAEGSSVIAYGHDTSVPNITLFSANPDNDITRLCNINTRGVITCIQELSDRYDYVLVDIKGNLNQETVVAAMESCTRVYSFIRPCISDVERIYKDTEILKRYSFGAKTQNIIISPATETLDEKELSEYGLKLVLSIPFVKGVESVGYNYELFAQVDGGASKASIAYLQCCKFLAERIANYETEKEVLKNGA